MLKEIVILTLSVFLGNYELNAQNDLSKGLFGNLSWYINGGSYLGSGVSVGSYYIDSEAPILGPGYSLLTESQLLIPMCKNSPWGLRLGEYAHAHFMLYGIGGRLDLIYYWLGNSKELHFSPGVAWSIGFLDIGYSYSWPLIKSSEISVNKHQFFIYSRIPIRKFYRLQK